MQDLRYIGKHDLWTDFKNYLIDQKQIKSIIRNKGYENMTCGLILLKISIKLEFSKQISMYSNSFDLMIRGIKLVCKILSTEYKNVSLFNISTGLTK